MRRWGAVLVGVAVTVLPSPAAADAALIKRPPLAGAATCDPAQLGCVARRAGVLWGGAAQPSYVEDPRTADTLARQFAGFTTENHLKWRLVHPEAGKYDFAPVDQLVAFAREHHLSMRGHVMVWHRGTPPWVSGVATDRATALAVLRDHIRTLFEHYVADRDVIRQWDIVNEALAADGTMRNSVWRQQIGPDYIEQAFRIAGEELDRVNDRIPGLRDDWQLQLFYNDFYDDTGVPIEWAAATDPGHETHPGVGVGPDGNCDANAKCHATQEMVRALVEAGAPIDGVGFQAHLGYATPAPDYHRMSSWLAPIGVRWAVTEIDLPCALPQVEVTTQACAERQQADGYGQLAHACLSDAACDTFVQWGITDNQSWYDTVLPVRVLADPLAFGHDYQPKPAAERLRALFRDATASGTPLPRAQLTSRRIAGDRVRLGVSGLARPGVRRVTYAIGDRIVGRAYDPPFAVTAKLTGAELRAKTLELTAEVRGGIQPGLLFEDLLARAKH